MSPDIDQAAREARVPVFLVGGKNLAFEGLRTLLLKNSIEIARVAANIDDLDLGTMATTARFLVIFDISDSVGAALGEIETLRHRFPRACIVVLLGQFQKNVALLPRHLSVNAILDRNIACEALMKTLQVALAGYGVLSPMAAAAETQEAASPAAAGSPKSTGLSDREAEIIGCIAEGHSNKVIARRFSISEATVKIHVRGILRKVDARNRTQAAIWALQKGFGTPVGFPAE